MNPLFLVNNIFPAYWVGQEDFSIDQIQVTFAYILDAEGWKLYKRNGVSTAVVKVDSVSGLPRLEPSIAFTAAKIPLDLIRKVTAWFKAVYLKYKSEAVGYLFYQAASGEWQFVPPTQTATGASAKYDEASRLPGWRVVGTIHSHASMPAFHSGVDDHDEEFFDGVHITVGRFDSVPEYSCSLVVQGKREQIDPSLLIDGMAPAETIPAIWLTAVKLSAPTGLVGLFKARATALYERYYRNEVSEAQYERELEVLRKESDAAEEAERKVILADHSSESSRPWDQDLGMSFPSRSSEPGGKKGGRHGRR